MAFFQDAHNFHVGEQNFHINAPGSPLKGNARITPGAIHDSAERCDAPKCHPETRVAVQNDLYDWILEVDKPSETPRKIKWVTGPAGCGKTAIMGSLAERCAENGVLGATFFFASWSVSVGRRIKKTLVMTIAHQLAQYREDLRTTISTKIEKNEGIFEKNLRVQMEVLVLAPLREVACRTDRPALRGAVIIDGLDECEAEQYQDVTSPTPRGRPERTKEEDQLEILQVLQLAASESSFPFRILVASRPERVFREFFDPIRNVAVFAKKLDLHEAYNADADITLFLEAELNRIGRRYNLPPSWLPLNAVKTLVDKASGQFIYAATVIRFLDTGHRDPPKTLLDSILGMEVTITSNPLEHLDALYSHILNSSPDPPFSVLWIHSIPRLNVSVAFSFASNINLLFQKDPEGNEAEHLLGNLHSLVQIPPLSDQATVKYDFYHKSLFDFLENADRCGKLYVGKKDVDLFIWNAFARACTILPFKGLAILQVGFRIKKNFSTSWSQFLNV
ncbi:hypothetical protein MD484_g1622, partial [Candolleomyces efflorescens]